MTDRTPANQDDADPVIPPAPPGAQVWTAPPGHPLAPPLGQPIPPAQPAPGPPPYAAPAYPVPGQPYPAPGQTYPAPTGQPYAAPGQPYAAPGQPYPAPGPPAGYPYHSGPTSHAAAYPLSSTAPPPPSGSPRRTALVIGLVGGIVAVVVALAFVFVGLSRATQDSAAPAPVVETSQPEQSTPAETSEAEPPDRVDAAAGAEIADRLEAKIDEYKRLRDSGALWHTIPDTEYNRTAVSAFLYFLTDMKVATIWGIDSATAQEYSTRMAMLEERLLAQQPLGDNIRIELEDRVFEYNGETGEGGYTDK